MKFKKLLTLSAFLSATLVVAGGVFLGAGTSVDSRDVKNKTIRFEPFRELKFRVDTLYLTNENFDSLYAKAAAGQFGPYTNTVSVTYLAYGDSANQRVKFNCDNANECMSIVKRHEMEHAIKANIVWNAKWMSRWDRARLAVMNEVMAPAGEIVEAVEYHIETGERYPQDRAFLWKADSLIMAQHEKQYGPLVRFYPVDFENSAIADVILESAVDKYAIDHGRGFYRTKIRKELAGVRRPKYVPHSRCIQNVGVHNYLPFVNQWGALWTYDVKAKWGLNNKKTVDIWNSASAKARKRTVEKVDSIVRFNMKPGQMMMPEIYKYPS